MFLGPISNKAKVSSLNIPKYPLISLRIPKKPYVNSLGATPNCFLKLAEK